MAGEDNLLGALSSFTGSNVVMEPVQAPITMVSQKTPVLPTKAAEKQGTLSDIAAQKQINIGGATQAEITQREFMKYEIAKEQQVNIPHNEMLTDAYDLTYADFRAKYGRDKSEILTQASEADRELTALRNAERTDAEVVADTLLGVISGIGNTVGGMTALNEVAENTLGVEVPLFSALSKGVGNAGSSTAKWAQDNKSDTLKSIQNLSALEKEVRAEESKLIYEQDKGDAPITAALQRVGRGAVSGFEAMIDNPALIGDVIAENVPSLAFSAGAGAVAAKGAVKARLLAQGYSDDVAERFLASSRGQEVIRKASTRLQPVLSGVQEAGGAAMQAGQTVDNLTYEQLNANSPEYRELIASGSTPEEAKAQIRNAVMGESAAVSGVTGLALGNLTKSFDAAPFATKGLGSVAKNLAGESVEEGVQGGVGELGQNVAMQRHADDTTDILEGVGEAAGEGIVAAIGLTGAAQGPGAVISGTLKTVKGAADLAAQGVQAASKGLTKRVENQVAEDAPEVPKAPEQAIETIQSAEINPIQDKLSQTFEINDEEVNVIDPKVKSLIQDEEGNIPRRRTEMIVALDQKFRNPETSHEDKLLIASEIKENIDVLFNMEDDATNEYINSLDENDEQVKAYQELKDFTEVALQQPSIIEAIQYLQNNKIEEVPENIGNQEAKIIAATASVAPTNVAPEVLSEVLDLARKRVIQLPEDSVKAIQSAIDISSVAKLYSDAVIEIDGKSPTSKYSAQEVSDQIVRLGQIEGQGKSLVQHAVDVQDLAKAGRTSMATDALQALTNFAETELNKINALHESSKQKKAMPYMAFSPILQEWISSESYTGANRRVIVHPNNDNSFKFYRKTFADASAAVAIQNTLAKQFPELGIEPLDMPKLSQSVVQKQRRHDLKKLDGLSNYKVNTTPSSKSLSSLAKKYDKSSGGNRPLTSLISSLGGIDPTSKAAEELKSRGITSKTHPNLFKKSSKLGDLDTIDASSYPYLATKVGKSSYYLDRQGLLDALAEEYAGIPQYTTQEQEEAAYTRDQILEEIDRLERESVSSVEPVDGNNAENVGQPAQDGTESYDAGIEADNQPGISNDQGDVAEAATEGTDVVPLQEQKPAKVEEPKRDLKERFGNLLNGRFAEVFDNDDKSTSVIKNEAQPYKKVRELMDAAPASTGKALVDEKFISLVPKMAETFSKRINADLARTKKDGSPMVDEEKAPSFRNLRSLIMTEKVEGQDRTYQMDQQIAETMALATMKGAMGLNGAGKINVEDMLQKQDIDYDGAVTPELYNFFLNTTPSHQVVKRIANDAMRMLGIRPKSSASEADTRGAFEAAAHDAIAMMRNAGILEVVSQTITDKAGNTKTLSGIKLKDGYLDENQRQTLIKNQDILTDLIDPEGERNFYIGQPPSDDLLRMNQKGTGLPLTAKQKAAIRNQSNIPHTINIHFKGIADMLGIDALKRIRGYVEITDAMKQTYNEQHLLSIEGKNKSIEMEIADTYAAIERMESQAKGKDISEVQIFFPYEITKVNRMQAVGPANGQSNKFARAALRSTWATLDLDNADHQEGFWRTVVQMSGVKVDGKKLEYLTTEEILNQGPDAIQKAYGPVIAELEAFFSGSEPNLNIIEQGLMGTEPVVLEALTAVARYNLAMKDGGNDGIENLRNSFRHSVPLEADGVTNGPAAVLMKFATGAFTPAQIEQFERIGYFFSKDKKSLKDKKAAGDTYGVTAARAEKNIALRSSFLDQDTQAKAYKDAINRFMSVFNPKGITVDTSVENAIWSLTRDAAKNPLTKTTYGAGAMGTARGIASEALDKFYAGLSEYNQGAKKGSYNEFFNYPEGHDLFADLMTLTKGYVAVDSKNRIKMQAHKENPVIRGLKEKDITKVALNTAAFENFSQNLNTVYVDGLFEAVKETMGSSFETMQKVIKAAQIQSATLEVLFEKFLDRIENSTTFSPKEYKEWEQRFKRLGAFIETQDQSFFVGKTEEGFITQQDGKKRSPRRIASATRQEGQSEFGTGFRSNRPTFAGVSAAAYINIGTGDGLMMTLAMANPIDGMDRVLQIYDGMEMPADKFREIGAHMNDAAYKAWQASTATDVLNSFENYARNFSDVLKDRENFTKEDEEKIMRKLYPYAKTLPSLDTEIKNQLADLRTAAAQIEARTAARAQFSSWTDQMAGADAPYHNQGADAGATYEAQAEALNKAAREHMQAKKDAPKRLAEANEALSQRIEEISEDLGGIKSVPLDQLPRLINSMSKQSRLFYRDVIRHAIPEGLEVYYGTSEELEKFRNINFPDKTGTASALSEVAGQYDRNHNVLFLVQDETGNNNIGETLLHELTHVAIADKVDAYFRDETMPKAMREAMERIVALVDDFLDLNLSYDSDRAKDAFAYLVQLRSARGTDSKVVNETLAEILTNPELMTIAQKQKVRNPVLNIIRSVYKALASVIPGLRRAGDTYFSNAAFNAQIVSKLSLGPIDPSNTGIRYSPVLDKTKQTGSKAKDTGAAIRSAVNQALNAKGLNNAQLVNHMKNVVNDLAILSFKDFVDAGFEFTPEEAQTYKQIMELFLSDAKVSGPALIRAQEIFESVVKELTVEHFMENEMLNDPNDRTQAQNKLNAVLGLTTAINRDSKKRSLTLPAFLALAASNNEFSDILSSIQAPSKAKFTYGSADEALTSVTQMALDAMTMAVVGEHKGSKANEAVENLLGKLATFEAEKPTMAEELYQNTYNMLDERASDLLDKGATALANKIDEYRKKIQSPIASLPLALAQGAVSMLSKTEAEKRLEGITMTLNTTPVFTVITELFAQIRGRTLTNANIYDMLNKVRFAVSSIREEFREQYPKILQEKFTRKLTKAEWKAMYNGIGQTDVSALIDTYSFSDIARFFASTNARKAKILALSKNIKPNQLTAIEELADYLANKKTAPLMRRNAYAIAQTMGGGDVKTIDNLITLFAIDKLNSETRKTMTKLFKEQPIGMEFAITQMKHFRDAEGAKHANNPIVQMNQWKGHIPSEMGKGVSLVLALNTDHKKMVLMGYDRVGDYHTDPKYSYYRTNSSMRNTYTQGVAQTVQASQNGIDVRTGRSVNGFVAGSPITGPMVQHILNNPQRKTDEHLLPVFNSAGRVIAFERSIRPEMLSQRASEDHFGKMLGAMAGRQVEEAQAKLFNTELVKNIKKMYDDEANRHNEYINLAKSTDPVHKDAWKAIPRDMKDTLAEVFEEEDFFPIRKDMVNLVVGYRNAGVSDLWTGISRVPEPVRETAKDLIIKIFGRKAYNRLSTAESVLTTAVSEAKSIIVVKSVIVPLANLFSNVLQLSTRGVPLRSIATKGHSKFLEITKYIENQEKGIKLQAELRSAKTDLERNKLNAQIETLKGVNRRLSIWPLIEAGEFNTISEGLTELDVNLKEGRFGNWVEAQVERMPEKVRTLGRYAVVSKSTALYKGLNRATQFGDFLAKAILYDDMVNRRKVDHAKAMELITEEFVNYNVPVGRSQTFLESFGLLWFPRYKIGSLKPAITALRDNPLRSFMSLIFTSQFSFLGSPLTDNVMAAAIDGRLDNSIGLGMGFRAPELNPWYALTQ